MHSPLYFVPLFVQPRCWRVGLAWLVPETGCHKWRHSPMPHPRDGCGWDHSSHSGLCHRWRNQMNRGELGRERKKKDRILLGQSCPLHKTSWTFWNSPSHICNHFHLLTQGKMAPIPCPAVSMEVSTSCLLHSR